MILRCQISSIYFSIFTGFESIENKGNFPYPYFFCVVGILIPLFVEKIWYKHDHSQIGSILTESTSGEGGAKKMLSTLMLVVTLSVHALIEGRRQLVHKIDVGKNNSLIYFH
jgi:hypothetical protein